MKIDIPVINDDTLRLFVNGEYVGDVTLAQTCKIRVDVVKYILNTGDTSILDTFYFIGHKDSNDVMGEEIKVTMDKYGNFSDSPWEINHVRRSMLMLIDFSKIKKMYEQ